MNDETCPVCAMGKLHENIEMNPVEYRGHKKLLKMYYSICDDCGSEIADARQTRLNKEEMVKFRANIDAKYINNAPIA